MASKGLPKMLAVGYNFELMSFLHRIRQTKVRVCCARQSCVQELPAWMAAGHHREVAVWNWCKRKDKLPGVWDTSQKWCSKRSRVLKGE